MTSQGAYYTKSCSAAIRVCIYIYPRRIFAKRHRHFFFFFFFSPSPPFSAWPLNSSSSLGIHWRGDKAPAVLSPSLSFLGLYHPHLLSLSVEAFDMELPVSIVLKRIHRWLCYCCCTALSSCLLYFLRFFPLVFFPFFSNFLLCLFATPLRFVALFCIRLESSRWYRFSMRFARRGW